MANNSYEEILRIVVKTSGETEAGKLAKTLLDLGKSGELTEDQIAGAAEEVAKFAKALDDVEKAAGDAAQLEKASAGLADLEAKLDLASTAAYQLKLQLGSVEKPTREMQKAFTDAAAEVTRLEGLHRRQGETVAKLDTELRAAGVDTSKLATEQARLRGESEKTVAAVRAQAEAARQQAEANRQLRTRLDEGDAAFRRQTQANRTSAEALKAHRDRTKEAETATRDLGTASATTTSIFSRMGGVVAGVLSYLSIRSAIEGIKNLLGLGDAAEKAQLRLAGLYGSQEDGNLAFERLNQIAKANAQGFGSMLDAAAKLKTFGLEPLDGTLQALIDQNAKLGGSQQTLEGIILAVGQAWAKQKLQGEEILQLVERGVPVWDLLQKATGKNVQELQKLSEQGKLGRDVMRQLLDEIGRSADGAAAKGLGTLTGLIQTARNNLESFFRTVNNSGVLEYFKTQLANLNAEVSRLAKTGELQRYAQEVSDAIVATGRAFAGVARFVVDHTAALGALIKTYVGFKGLQLTGELYNIASAWKKKTVEMMASNAAAATATGSFGKLGATLRALPTALKIGVAVIGFQVLQKAAELIAKIVAQTEAADRAQEASKQAMRARFQEEVNQIHLAMGATVEYRNVQVKTALEVARLSDEELERYKQRLEGARQFALQQHQVALRQREIHGATDETNLAIAESLARLKELGVGFDAAAKGAELAGEALRLGIGAAAAEVTEQLKGVAGSADDTAARIKTIFDGFDESTSVTRLGDVALALNEVGNQGTRAGDNIRAGLATELRNLSGAELQRFSSSAQAAFDEYNVSAERSATVTGTVLLVAMERLGLAGAGLGVKFTEGGREILAVFETIVESANATRDQIEAAFNAALSKTTTVEEAEALGAALERAARRAELGLAATGRTASALKDQIDKLTNAADPLNSVFERLGLTSQRELDRIAATAQRDFELIRQAFRSGTAEADDVERAFLAMAKAQLDASRNAKEFEQRSVQATLRTKAEALGLKRALEELGLAGAHAGEQVAGGADKATDALRDTAAAAGDAANAAAGLSSEGANATAVLVDIGDSAGYASDLLSKASEEFFELTKATAGRRTSGGGRESETFEQLQREVALVEEELQLTEEQNRTYTRRDQILQELQGRYRLVKREVLEQLAAEREALEQNVARREEEARRRLEMEQASKKAAEDAAKAKNNGESPPSTPRPGAMRIDLVVRNEQRAGSLLRELTDADLRTLGAQILQAINEDGRRS